MQQEILADALKYTILPLLVLSTWRINWAGTSAPQFEPGWLLLSALLATALILTSNNSAAFLLASATLVSIGRGTVRQRSGAAFLIVGVPVLVGFGVRVLLDQQGSHAMGVGAGRYSPDVYARQLFDGIGSLLFLDRPPLPTVAALLVTVALVALWRYGQQRRILSFSFWFVGASLLATFALFNVTWVNDSLNGRFILFAPLVLVPLLLMSSIRHSALMLLAYVLIFTPLLYRTGKWVKYHLTETTSEAGYSSGFVPMRARLSPKYVLGPPIDMGAEVLLAPPQWHEDPGRQTP